MRRATVLLASLAIVFAVAPSAALATPSTADTWIVTLADGRDPHADARSFVRAHGGEVKYVYEHALNGFAFRGSAEAAEAIRRNPNVTRVEADAEVWLDETQSGATWGLDRIDQRSGKPNGTYTYDATGAGVTAYVIDSGIRFSHVDFSGRARLGTDLVIDGQNGNDCNGHGTHVSGTIGGETWGVAKDIALVSVRVFGCSGGSSWSTIISAIEWVIIDHDATEPAVANMSLGGGANSSVDDAVQNMINDGVSTAVAAGNGDRIGRQADACNYSPARVPAAMTISATNSSDAKASWANYGSCVDWFAPGVSITSAWIDSDTDTNTISGTSMATPHTAGVAALYLEDNPAASPSAVRTALYDATTKGVVTSSSTANNHLLYSRLGVGTLTGTVTTTDATTEATIPIAGANVSIEGTALAATTDSTGVYSISNVPAGSQTATATASGYDAQSAVVEISAGSITRQDFALTASSGGGGSTSFSIDLVPSSGSPQGSTWTATVTISATDASTPLDGVKVDGEWSDGATGTATCTTGNGTGQCTVSVEVLKRVSSVTFTVTGATDTGGGLTYDLGPDSTTVLKPS